MGQVRLVVYGVPQPQGSTRAFVPKGWSRAVVTADNPKTKPWRKLISNAARRSMGDASPTYAAVSVLCNFFFVRPKGLKKAILEKTTRPDTDKLLRAVLDALTGIVYMDDSQVTFVSASKSFDPKPRVEIEVNL